jgi:hypothetical protein
MKSLLEELPDHRLSGEHPDRAALLTRIAADLEVIAGVLGAFPARNPEVWESSPWAKDRKDLAIACERMRAAARLLDEISGTID